MLEMIMRKGTLIVLLLVLFVSFIPNFVEASPATQVKFTPCIAEDGTYKLTIDINSGFGPTLNGIVANGFYGYSARIRKNGGPWTDYNYGKSGLTLKFGQLPSGTKFEVELMAGVGADVLSSVFIIANPIYSITLQGNEYPPCFKKCEGTPLFKMYLLTRPDSYCLLISDVHPSVESQKALCFQGIDWVATKTACEGWVCNNGCWDCDYLNFERLPFKDLKSIYERRMGLLE
jgi:hypothetical protein